MVVRKKPNSPKINIAIDGQHIEQITSYMYLGSLITEDGRSEKDIKRRIMIARSTFTNMRTRHFGKVRNRYSRSDENCQDETTSGTVYI